MAVYGYARVSTTDQDLTVQVDALKAAGCEVVRAEKITGTTRQGRKELDTLLDFIRQDDVLVVTKLDRLARSVADLSAIVDTLEKKGAKLRILNASIDTGTPTGRAFLQMLGVFGEFETAIRKERQMEGISKAKASGVYKGRKRSIDADEVFKLQAFGNGPTQIAEKLKIGRASVYRVLREREKRFDR
jgi:DNA invertase Pin-like site-specific DNA recombinase